MKKEHILYGVQVNDPDYMESIITSTESRKHLEDAITWANANGFNRLRITTFSETTSVQELLRRSVQLK